MSTPIFWTPERIANLAKLTGDGCSTHQIAERFFFGLSARVEMVPVMAAEDLRKGLSATADIVQRYG